MLGRKEERERRELGRAVNLIHEISKEDFSQKSIEVSDYGRCGCG